MAVVKVGMEDTLGGAFRGLGAGVHKFLEEAVYRKQIREKELKRDPAMMQSLLPGALVAQATGPEALQAMADGLDVRLEFMDAVLSYTETRPQQEARIFMEEGGAETVVAAEIGEAKVGVARAETDLAELKEMVRTSSPALMVQARNAIAKKQVATVAAEEQVGLYATQAEADAANAQRIIDISESLTDEQIANSRLRIAEVETWMNMDLVPAEAKARLATAELTIAEWNEISRTGLIPERVRAQLLEAGVSIEVSEASRIEGLPGVRARAERLRLISETQQLTVEQELGFPAAKARTAVAVLSAERVEALAREDLIVRSEIAGVPQLTVDAQVLTAQAQMADADLSLEAATGIKNYIDTLDLTRDADGNHINPAHAKIQRELFLGLSNPAYLQVLAQREGREIETSLRLAALTQQGEADKLSTTLQLEDTIAEAIVALGEASGDEQVEAAKVRVENLRKIAADMMLSGRILPLDLIGVTGKRGKYEFFFDEVESGNVKEFLGVAGTLIEAGGDPDAVLAQALAEAVAVDPDTGLLANGRPALSFRELEELTERFPEVIETVEASAQLIARLQGQVPNRAALSRSAQERLERNRQAQVDRATQIISDLQARLLRDDILFRERISLNERIARQQETLDRYEKPLNTLSYEQLYAFLGIDANTLIARVNAAYPPLEEPR